MTYCKPFLKWAGGKTKLAPLLASKMPAQIQTYHEPFLGGGALFCHLASENRFVNAVLGDRNLELVNCWKEVKRDWQMTLMIAEAWDKDVAEYETVRSKNPDEMGTLERAARVLYLNQQCFNGLWRVNASGKFNVPWGKKARLCGDRNILDACWRALQRATISFDDFEVTTRGAILGDAVYFDPPYPPRSKTANFTAYSNGWKGEADHVRLEAHARTLAERGVFVIASNADTRAMRELWSPDRWNVEGVQMRRNINSKGSARGAVGELVIWSKLL